MGLLQLDSGIADDLAPQLVIRAQPLGGGFNRTAAGLRAKVEEALADLGIVDGRLQVPIEEAADVGRRAPWSEDREPRAHLPSRKAGLRRSGDVGQPGEALLGRRGERTE